jgi:uncharacterized membrane protein
LGDYPDEPWGDAGAARSVEISSQETPPIPSHALAALAAVVLGGWQLTMQKGTRHHRALGWIWVGLMAYVAGSSFLISELRLWGAFGPIHLLSAWTLGSLVMAVHRAPG